MRHHATQIELRTRGRGTQEITSHVQRAVEASGIRAGLCTVFVHHTSASLILCENADPDVRQDVETFLSRWVPDGDPQFVHRAEGPDDMPAHLRTILTQSSVSIPVASSRCDLGTWQGLFLYEHRSSGHRRRLTITVVGDET